MTDTDPIRDPAYWSDLIDSYEESEGPPDPASMAADDVSRMLGALRRLTGRLADYDMLHLRELARLDERRTKMVGPVIDRIAALEGHLRDYARRAYEDFGKTGTILATPNGSIRAGRPLVVELSIKDEAVEPWLKLINPDGIHYTPKVGKADLRFHLEQYVERGMYRQAIVIDHSPDGVTVVGLVEPGEQWTGEFAPDWVGIWVRPDHAAAGHMGEPTWPQVGDIITDSHLLVQGVTWSPVGERGSGRNFTIDIS